MTGRSVTRWTRWPRPGARTLPVPGTTWLTCRSSTRTISARFAPLAATANIQPLWATHEPQMDELTIPFLGERRAGWQYPFRSLQAAGATMCAGSDWPVSSPNPLWGAHVAVNRDLPAPAGGGRGDQFLAGQALSLESVLAAYTSGSAWVNGLEAVSGSIAEGLDADLAVVDADLSRLPAAGNRPGGGHPDLGPGPARVRARLAAAPGSAVAAQEPGRGHPR